MALIGVSLTTDYTNKIMRRKLWVQYESQPPKQTAWKAESKTTDFSVTFIFKGLYFHFGVGLNQQAEQK